MRGDKGRILCVISRTYLWAYSSNDKSSSRGHSRTHYLGRKLGPI